MKKLFFSAEPIQSHYLLYIAEAGMDEMALSKISPQVRVRVSVSIVLGLATGGYSWIWPMRYGGDVAGYSLKLLPSQSHDQICSLYFIVCMKSVFLKIFINKK